MKRKRLLLVWSGGVNPNYHSFFSQLARAFDLQVLSPKTWRHGSLDFRASALHRDAPEFSLASVHFLALGGARYVLPGFPYRLLAFRPDVLYILDDPDRLALTFHLLLARLLLPGVKTCALVLQNILQPSYYGVAHRLAWKWNSRLLDGLIGATDEAGELARRHGYGGEQTTLPLWVAEDVFLPPRPEEKLSARQSLGIQDGEYVLAFAGSLHQAKGINRLVALLQARPHLRLLLASGQNWDESIPLRNPPLHLGGLVGKELLRLYHAADAVILPSEPTPYWKEQLGRTLLEGGLCGCLALGSDSGAIPTVIQDRDCLFRAGDDGDLARLLDSLPLPGTSEKIARQRQRFLDHYGSRIVAERTAAFLHSLGQACE